MATRPTEPALTGAPVKAESDDAILTRDDILAIEDVRYEYVRVKAWGDRRVRIRSLTAADRDAYDAQSYRLQQAAGEGADGTAALTNFRARRVVLAVVDEAGERVFKDRDAVALSAKNGAAIDELDTAILRLSGMDTEAVRRAVEALKADQSDGSGTA